MFKVDNTRVYGLEESIIASGYPMKTGAMEDMDMIWAEPKDFKRSESLGNAKPSSGHDCFLKGIVVQFDLTFSQVMHRQILRYHFLDIVSSQSLMHRITTGEHTFNEYVSDVSKHALEMEIRKYNNDPSRENFKRVIYNAPMGTELTARFTTNYLQLKTIVNQREYHKLDNEWGEFCRWVRSLPEFENLAMKNKGEKKDV